MSGRPVLYIGNKRYSSWSLRAWLVLKHAGIEFDEVVIPLDTPDFAREIAGRSPTRRVPALHTDGAVIWDSLAIAEWAAERARGLWPADLAARARARSHAATMHAGFQALRTETPMNLAREGRPRPPSDAVVADLALAEALWRDGEGYGGPFLFGAWSIADAFWTPLATRIRSYDLPVGPDARAYVETLLAEPHYRAWREAALLESYDNPLRDRP